jgi:cytochrome c553
MTTLILNEDRTMNKIIGFILGLGMYGLLNGALLAADIVAGEQKASACFGCHGQEGNSNNPVVPNLAGQQSIYLNNQITAFREGKRINPIMSLQAKHLSDADISNIAAYFASRKTKSASAHAAPAQPAATKASQCTGCHTGTFGGRSAIPKLAGQQLAYLAKQLRDFKSGARKSGPMQAITANLSDVDIDQLATFLSSL